MGQNSQKVIPAKAGIQKYLKNAMRSLASSILHFAF
jgi:hypothetical protein